ncbi:MAG: XdhC family protein, partial [Lachnospiraceae bacterium]|nr:XdhC family protein [Lachnospiraceae bacterium]
TIEGEGLYGKFEGSEEVKREMAENPLRLSLHSESDKNRRYILDRLGTCGTMYIFGGGHVSLEVAELAKRLDFNVTVIDDREEYANAKRFPGCRTMVVDSYTDIPDLKIGLGTYILIITRGHAGDFEALKWALKGDPFYVGMIGSRKKRDIIFGKLRELGYAEDKITAVHSPVGLTIGAKTPAEIAVSIMAEVIKCRYEA